MAASGGRCSRWSQPPWAPGPWLPASPNGTTVESGRRRHQPRCRVSRGHGGARAPARTAKASTSVSARNGKGFLQQEGGGRTSGGRTPWGYYLAIGAVVILGTALVYVSRDNHLKLSNNVGPTPPVVGVDHWHEAYGFYVCTSATAGKFIPSFPYQVDAAGIHTAGDGVIDIHPYEDSAAGKNAVLGVFTEAVHVTLNAGELGLPSFKGYSGHIYHDSDSCGGKPGHVQVQTFATPTAGGVTWKKDPREVPLADQSMVVVAFVPNGAP